MSAKVIPFPKRYPPAREGVSFYRRPDGWFLRHERAGRIMELPISPDEIRDLHQSAELIIDVYL